MYSRLASLERSLTFMKQFEGDIQTYNKHLSPQDSFILSMYHNYILILYKVSII